MLGCHRRLHRLGEGGITDQETELDVAVLSAEGEVGAREQHHLVVDDDELGVADYPLAVGELGRLVDGRLR